jgi:hypothetical protein
LRKRGGALFKSAPRGCDDGYSMLPPRRRVPILLAYLNFS